MKTRKHYVTVECAGFFMVKPREWTYDDRRWYFDTVSEAEEWADYLERTAP